MKLEDEIDLALDEVENKALNYLPRVEKQSDLLNIIDFSLEILELDLWFRQKFILKIFYNLPIDEDEKEEIIWLKENKGLIIPENYQFITFKELIIIAGRRASKSLMAALIAAYELYRILNLYNPQRFYGQVPGTTIYVLHVAAEEKQAEQVQDYLKNFLHNSTWFDPYVENIKEREIRFLTQFDKDNNYEKGTIRVYSLTSNSSSIAGRGAKVVILDEIARMMDTTGRSSGQQIYDALTPSVKTYKDEGKIINISSPRQEGGILYDLKEKSQRIDSMICFEYASWELNQDLTEEDFADEFDKNPEMAQMEFGAKFGKTINRAFSWDKIDKIIQPGTSIRYRGERDRNYVICCDPATKSAERYGIAWLHAEMIDDDKFIFIDGLKYYQAKIWKNKHGMRQVEEVDLDEADNFVIALVRDLKTIYGVFYDQGKSTASIQKLKKKGIRAKETTFTNKYKTILFNDTQAILNQERLKAYEYDPQNAIGLFIDEFKCIEREITGDIIKIHHPPVGRVKTDDLYDAVSNAIHLLIEEDPKKITHVVTQRPRIVTAGTRKWR